MKTFLKTLLILIYNSAFIIHHSFSQAPGIEWEKSLGGTNNDFANSVQQTSDGGYIVAGYSSSNDGNVSGNTLAVLKDVVVRDNIATFGGGVFNVGGGIVFDSTAEAEYEECLLKARFAVGDRWIKR